MGHFIYVWQNEAIVGKSAMISNYLDRADRAPKPHLIIARGGTQLALHQLEAVVMRGICTVAGGRHRSQ